ncbi:MAG: hypothetical protein ACJA16_002146 [Akkermansiaceae bacterium]|jgi:hypothetical protein
MKTIFLSFYLIAMCAITSVVSAQSLQQSWGYIFDETVAGKQIVFITPLNAGSDGSVAFVVTRGDGGAGGLENRIFWLKAKADGTSPTGPLWTSDWEATSGFTDVVAVRRNHLVYTTGRELRSVTIDGAGTASVSTVKAFAGAEEGGDPLIYTVEQARAPGFVFAIATQQDKRGFTLSAFKFAPGPPEISAIATVSTISGSNLSISFQSELGANYRLQSSTTLEAANWQDVGNVIVGTGNIQTVAQQGEATKLFFRIVAL